MRVVGLQAGRRLSESILQLLRFAGLVALAQLLAGQSYLQVTEALLLCWRMIPATQVSSEQHPAGNQSVGKRCWEQPHGSQTVPMPSSILVSSCLRSSQAAVQHGASGITH